MRTLADRDPIYGCTDIFAPLTHLEALWLHRILSSAYAENFRRGGWQMRSDLSALLLDVSRQMRAKSDRPVRDV